MNFKKQPFQEVTVKLNEIADPSPELKVKAEVYYINKILFEKIQSLQQGQGQETEAMKATYDEIKLLDVRLDDIHTGTFKIKNKVQRKELVQVIQECKERTKNAVSIVRACLDSGRKIDNASIAKLNDLAFKGIKQGTQKRLDERAIKNQEFFQKLEDQVQKAIKKMNFDKIKEENKEILNKIGTCPLSTNDVIDALKEGECFCIQLKIRRPNAEAVIADPSRLGIN